MSHFRGNMTALVTPFDGEVVDVEKLRELVEWQIDEGVDGLVPCGTTGEAATMNAEEWRQVVAATIEQTAGRVPVVAGTGTNNTRASVDRTKLAAELGCDGALVVAPYYNKPTQGGLLAHYRAVAQVGLPIIAYNVPGRCGVSMTVETVVELVREPNVVALKEATGDMRYDAALLGAMPEDLRAHFSLLSGDDFTSLPLWCLGGDGMISVVSNVAPRETSVMWDSFCAGELASARRIFMKLMPVVEALFVEPNPIGVKAALEGMGRIKGDIRLPMTPASESTRWQLKEALEQSQVLRAG